MQRPSGAGRAFRARRPPSSTEQAVRAILTALIIGQLAGAGAILAVGEAHASHPGIPLISLR